MEMLGIMGIWENGWDFGYFRSLQVAKWQEVGQTPTFRNELSFP